jgi:phosphatidylglycerol---prolipoprotein diacylglyceryl transferase
VHPILFNLGSFRLPTYGVLLVLALISAVVTADRLGRREGFDPDRILDASVWIIVTGIVGAKVLMVLTDWRYYWQYPGELVSASTLLAGGVFYGGFIAACLFGLWYIHVHRMPVGKVFDINGPAVAVAQSIGRLGCLAAGCDYGRPTHSALGVIFTNPLSHQLSGVPLGIRLYPTQILESLATFVIFGILLWRYRHKTFDGQIFLLYVVLYGTARFFLEFLRGDEDRGFVFGHLLSTSQLIALVAIVTAAGITLWRRRRLLKAG